MAHVNTYLNFVRKTEEAFNFYKSVFKSEFEEPGISRFGDIPQTDGMLPLPDTDKNLVMHVSLKILGEHIIMGTDAPESMGFNLVAGNNVHISLEPDTKDETDRLFKALSDNGKVTMELQDTFWGAYYGSCTDKFGINWMFNFQEKQNPYLK
jgi:PhnB protein